MEETGDHTSDHWGGEGFHDLGALAVAPHDGKEAGDDGADGHDFRAQAEAGSVFDGLGEVLGVCIKGQTRVSRGDSKHTCVIPDSKAAISGSLVT